MRTIELTKGFVAVVDEEDYDRLTAYRWQVNGRQGKQRRCAVRNVKLSSGANQMIYMHREVLQVPASVQVDHINCDALDNRKANLRPATNSQNNANTRIARTNTSGFKGVSWIARIRKWQARIKVLGSARYLGVYANPEDAARVYDSAAREAFGSFARLNFPRVGEQTARWEIN